MSCAMLWKRVVSAAVCRNQCLYYSTRTGDRDTSTVERIQPVSLAFNSYETTSSETTAPPIIIMHGLFGSKSNWRSISKALLAKTSPTRKVFSVDARNHGESPHSPNHRYEDLAEDVAEFYRQQNLSKAVVLGHSMGGRAMMTFALKYPELVEKAIIVDVSPITSSPALKNMGEIFAAMRRVKIDSGVNAAEGRAMADKQIMEFIPDKVTRDFILMNLYQDADGDFKWCINVNALQSHRSDLTSFPEHMKTSCFPGAMLFLGGTRSHLLKEQHLIDMAAYYPRAELKFIEGGHNIGLVDNREYFIDYVAAFLNDKKMT